MASVLRTAGLVPTEQHAEAVFGEKDGGVTLALAIAGLAINAVGTLIAGLSFWRQRHPAFRASVTVGDVQISTDVHDDSDLAAVVARLRQAVVAQPQGREVQVTIHRTDGSD